MTVNFVYCIDDVKAYIQLYFKGGDLKCQVLLSLTLSAN